MAFAGQPTLTAKGQALMTKVMSGSTLKFTQLKLGSGTPSASDTKSITALAKEEASVDVSEVKRGENYVSVKGTFDNSKVTSGFYWKEFGIFAQDPDDGEVLLAYAYAGSQGDYISPSASSEIVKTLTAVIAISDAESISVEIVDSIVYASKEEIKEVTAQIIKVEEAAVVSLEHSKSGTTHSFTGLGDRTGLVVAQFKATASYNAGDTATIDGATYTIQLTGADDPETDLFVKGKSIIVDVDVTGKTLNFRTGGGLTNGKLAQTTATEDKVFNGYTFYSGNKELKTGTALSQTTTVKTSNLFSGKTAYDSNGKLIEGTALSQTTTANSSTVFSGKTAYDNNGNLITGSALSKATTAKAAQIFSGQTAYDNNGTLITGSALSTPITATTDDVNPGMTYYDENGVLKTGTRQKVLRTEIFQADGTFTVPDKITSINVRLFGGGGRGGNGGGGGGGYMSYATLDVTPGDEIPVTIGLGGGQSGNSSSKGGTTSFGTLLSANGGSSVINSLYYGCGGSGGTGGGAGGSVNSANATGGSAWYGGGGGGRGARNIGSAVSAAGSQGGPSFDYGGGGGGGGAISYYKATDTVSGGAGGNASNDYGGAGGAGGNATASSAAYGRDGTAGTDTSSQDLDFTGTGKAGSGGSYAITSPSDGTSYCYDSGGGAGGGGYGGTGGNGGNASYGAGSTHCGGGGGGGGGYGASGGAGTYVAGGGGGGYGGKGGDGYVSGNVSDSYPTFCGGGGGGYGTQGNGGSGLAVAGGIAAGGSGGTAVNAGGLGGNGIAIITYLE